MRRALRYSIALVVAVSQNPTIGFAVGESVAEQNCQALVFTERGGQVTAPGARSLLPRSTVLQAGKYCLDQDVHQKALFDFLRGRESFMPLEAIIRIQADDVWIDLAGHTVSNSARPGMTMIWFSKFAEDMVGGTRIKSARIGNGRLESPGVTGIGIDLTASKRYGPVSLQVAPINDGMTIYSVFADTRHVIESMSITAGRLAIQLDGSNNTIRNNRILVDGATAIIAQGPGIVIEDNIIEVRNDFRGFDARDRKEEALTSFPIRLIQADGAVIRNNRIRLVDRTTGASLPAAIELVESRDVTVSGNQFAGIDEPVRADTVSSYSTSGNQSDRCAPSSIRHLAPHEGATEDVPRAPACR